ncbi:MAG: hypothetical protein ACQESR_21575 [Planctomycetota bacterium]
MAAQHNWTVEETAAFQQIVALHEIGHQFELLHHGTFLEHVMEVHNSDAQEEQLPEITTVFRDEDIVEIREHGSGTNRRRPWHTL